MPTILAPVPSSAQPDPKPEARQQRKIEQELRLALERSVFELHYQPRFAVRTTAAVGAEALIRWPQRPRGGTSPAILLATAQRMGLGAEIGAWTLRTACAEAAHWGSGTVAIGVSAAQLGPGWPLLGQVAEALKAARLVPHRLEVEIPESLLAAGDADTLLALAAMRDAGIGVALDDFGAGEACLSALKRLPLGALRLGRAMIRGLPADREDTAILRAVIGAAHAVGLTVAAKGVETEAQRELLAELGCDELQGHLLAPPVPAPGIRAWFPGPRPDAGG